MIGTPISQILKKLESREVSAVDLVGAYLNRIKNDDDYIGAFISVFEKKALAQAQEIDRKRAAGEPLGSLAGLPVAVKDNINVKGFATTCASKILEDFVSPYDAHVIEKLREADAVMIGKTNMDEFAMGSSTEYSAMGKTRNPVNPERVPGGSSGGSTAAVAAGFAPLALGSSTGGSIRQPAAFCGVVGFKPTYGRVSRYGLVSYGSSLDQIGTIAEDVDGAARLFQVIAGHDQRDSTSVDQPCDDYLQDATPEPLRIGISAAYGGKSLDPDIATAQKKAVELLREAGAQIVDLDLPHTKYAVPAYYLIATAEASSNLSRYDGVRYSKRAENIKNLQQMYTRSRAEGMGLEVKRRILLGTYCLSSGYYEGYYLNAQRVRTKIVQDFQSAFEKVDCILTPTTPTSAFPLGSKLEDPVAMYLQDIYTVTANLAGLPAISIPAGKDRQDLPIGLQLLGGHFQEATLLKAGRHLENLLNAQS